MSLLLLGAIATFASCGSDDPSPVAGSAVSTPAAESPDTTEASATAATEDPTTSTSVPVTDSVEATTASTPATEPGDVSSEFCTSAAEAKELGDEVQGALSGPPEELESVLTAALEAADATVELAPPDIADLMESRVEFQRRLAALLEENEWDSTTALESPEGKDLLQDGEAAADDLAEVRRYLELNCGIESDGDASDSSVPITVLPEGDEGLRQFIQLYALGAGVEVTDEQEDCFVEELSGKVDVEQLEDTLTGEAAEDVKVALGVAVLSCDIPFNE